MDFFLAAESIFEIFSELCNFDRTRCVSLKTFEALGSSLLYSHILKGILNLCQRTSILNVTLAYSLPF